MVLDKLINCEKYFSLNKHFEISFQFLKQYLENPLDVGKYQIDGEKIFALVQNYETKDNSRFESHKKYIDIQFMISGEEIFEYADKSELVEIEDKTPIEDMIFYNDGQKAKRIIFKAGDFAIFFPNDGHKPGLISEEISKVKKIVIKVEK